MAEGETIEHHEVHEVHETAPVIEPPAVVAETAEAAHDAGAATVEQVDAVADAIEDLGDEQRWRETHERLNRIETTLAEIRGSLSSPAPISAPTIEASSSAPETPSAATEDVIEVEESPPASPEESPASRKRSGRLRRLGRSRR